MMSESMVEKVARALAAQSLDFNGNDAPVDTAAIIDRRWPNFLLQARAAIEAMRDPTPEMKEAGIEAIADAEMTVRQWLNFSADDLGPAFNAMIDRALTPQSQP